MLTAHPSNVLACEMDWGRGSRGLSVKGTKDQIDQILILLKDIIACLREVIIGPGVSCAFTIEQILAVLNLSGNYQIPKMGNTRP